MGSSWHHLYSFQAPTFFQINSSTTAASRNLLLQISALGSGVAVEDSSVIFEDGEGETIALKPTETFVLSSEERGGIGTTYVLQWNLEASPIQGD